MFILLMANQLPRKIDILAELLSEKHLRMPQVQVLSSLTMIGLSACAGKIVPSSYLGVLELDNADGVSTP
jgi:hypothetical protein